MAIVRLVQQHGETQQALRHQRVAAGNGVVHQVFAPRHQLLVVDAGLEEAAIGWVVELRQRHLRQPRRLAQPAQVEGRLIERQQPADHGGIVLQVGIEAGASVLVRAQQAAIGLAHLRQDEVGRINSGRQRVGAAQGGPTFGQGVDHQPVPLGQNFLVTAGLDAPFAHGKQLAPALGQHLLHFLHPDAEALGHVFGRAHDTEDVLALEVAAVRDAVVRFKNGGAVRIEGGFDLGGRPDKELAFVPLAVGVLRAVKAPFRRRHLTQHVVDRLLHDAAVERAAHGLPGMQIGAQQLGVVVEHLLEMGDEPVAVHAVAVKTAAKLVVDAALRHLFQRQFCHVKSVKIARAPVLGEGKVQRHRLRELGLAAEAAVLVVEIAAHLFQRGVQRVAAHLAPVCRQRGGAVEHGRQAPGLIDHALALRPVRVGDGVQHLLETRHPIARLLGVIRAAVKGLAFGRQPDAHGPAALAGHRLHGLHINRIQVGPLLAIHLDVDKEVVHQGGSFGVLKRFVLHNVAPVAGAVANREKDRLVLGARPRQRLLAPGVPVHRIVGVLEQVGRRLVDQPVGVRVIGLGVSAHTLW